MPFLTPADFLASGLHLPPLAAPPVALGIIVSCSITGQPITMGYPVRDMVTGATAEFLDCFRGGMHGWVSETAARCFKSANPRRGNPTARAILAFEDVLYQPLINREAAAEQGRPCWRDLARAVWPARKGQPCLAILTTDTKKRLWIHARVGSMGGRTPLLYYDSKTCGNEILLIDWPVMLECLGLIERVYSLGFPKEVMRHSLYNAGKIVQAVGLAKARRYECELSYRRSWPEFLPALLIAQKDEAPAPQKEETNDSDLRPDHGAAQLALL